MNSAHRYHYIGMRKNYDLMMRQKKSRKWLNKSQIKHENEPICCHLSRRHDSNLFALSVAHEENASDHSSTSWCSCIVHTPHGTHHKLLKYSSTLDVEPCIWNACGNVYVWLFLDGVYSVNIYSMRGCYSVQSRAWNSSADRFHN